MIAIGVKACISHTAKGPMPTDRKLIEASRTWQIYLAYPLSSLIQIGSGNENRWEPSTECDGAGAGCDDGIRVEVSLDTKE